MDDPYAADAPYYDLVHANAPQDDIGLWVSFAGRTTAPVLEVGTGTGRIALALAAAGHTVTAIDPSATMLERARARAASAAASITFVAGSVLDAQVAADSFGFVVVPADVFLYCADTDEQVRTLQAIARALTFNGTLALDLPGPAMWLDPAANGQLLLAYEGEDHQGRHLEVWHLREDDLATQQRRLTVRYETVDSSGLVSRHSTVHRLRYLYRFEAECLLRLAGLQLSDVYGDYDLGTLTSESERMIVIARRAGS